MLAVDVLIAIIEDHVECVVAERCELDQYQVSLKASALPSWKASIAV